MAVQPDKVTARCGLCGWSTPNPTEGQLAYHLATVHPLDMLANEKVQLAIARQAYKLGWWLAGKLKGEK